MKNNVSISEQIQRYALSPEMHQNIIEPILKSGKLENPLQFLDLLKMLNKQLWESTSTNQQQVNQGLSELAEIYRFTVTLGQSVHLCEHTKPHFGVQELEVETNRLEYSESDDASLLEHISRAAASIHKPSSRKTRVKSREKVIDIVLPQRVDKLGIDDEIDMATPIAHFKQIIKQALDQSYQEKNEQVELAELYSITDKVIISTPICNLSYRIDSAGNVSYSGSSLSNTPPQLARKSLMARHWKSLHHKASNKPLAERKKAAEEGIEFTPTLMTA
ncbi:hypothetical protein [Pelagibaculum spongiae]|uniref:Uncharacterized protein n=1 Tax=Pelagibaculum spongiae TaxID=2080658 RepID=A0A2V1GUT3_9GAMM|nr:hypothetical protein [Pelagibaculum spongiae]PVZ62943.1 hypothetical protein DC094_21485 [Pelagibaculum spongiae]